MEPVSPVVPGTEGFEVEMEYKSTIVGGREIADFDEATREALRKKFEYQNRN